MCELGQQKDDLKGTSYTLKMLHFGKHQIKSQILDQAEKSCKGQTLHHIRPEYKPNRSYSTLLFVSKARSFVLN
jgi:hypothetical protein